MNVWVLGDFPEATIEKEIMILDIPDAYQYMDPV